MTTDYLWEFIILAGVIGLMAGMVIEGAHGYIQARLERREFKREGRWNFPR